MISDEKSGPSIWDKVKEFLGFIEVTELSETVAVEEKVVSSPRLFKGSLVNSHNAHKFSVAEIKVVEPRIYEDSLNIAMFLRENIPVLVNLKFLDNPSSKRLIDFVCGTAYAINGHMLKVGENIFLFTPAHVLIVDAEDKTTFEKGLEQEEKEVFFKRTASL